MRAVAGRATRVNASLPDTRGGRPQLRGRRRHRDLVFVTGGLREPRRRRRAFRDGAPVIRGVLQTRSRVLEALRVT